MNLFEIVYDGFKPFLDDEKKPLNVLEVSNLWFYLAATESSMRNEEIAYNIVQDPELREKLKDLKENIHKPMYDELIEFLTKEGVPLPKETPEKPIGNFKDLPDGAKLNDEEIANLTSYNLLLGINSASKGLTESIRADVGMMFAKFFIKKSTYSLTIKQLLEKNGWLHTPPYYKS